MMKPAPLRTHGAAVYPFSQALAERYTLESRFDDDFPLYIQQGPELWLPRRLAPELGDDLRDDGIVVPFKSSFVPRHDDQLRVVEESDALLAMGVSHVLMAATGFGKTFVGCDLAARRQRRFLVITTKQDLIKHWVTAGKTVLGLQESQISIWSGDKEPDSDAVMVVGLVQSILKGPERYGVQAYRGFGLVICDEVHRMGADQFSQAMWWLPAKLRLGLSATPQRKDGKDVVFLSHIGEVLVRGEQETLPFRVIVQHTSWRCPRKYDPKLKKAVPIKHSSGRTMHLNPSLASHQERNADVAEFTYAAYTKKRSTIVFADTMEHLKAMRAATIARGVKECDTGWYVGLTADVYEGPAKEREKQREKAKAKAVIYATYKMASEGTDIPWLDTMVLGSPRADVIQIVGRIRREYESKGYPLVLDLVDMDSPIFAQYAASRLRWYKSLNSDIKVYR